MGSVKTQGWNPKIVSAAFADTFFFLARFLRARLAMSTDQKLTNASKSCE
jgi:hypothetical protein